MIAGAIVAYALTRGAVRVVTRPGIEDVLETLRRIYPPPYVVREVTEAEFRRLQGWPAA